MRTLGVVGLSVVLILVLLYQSYVLTEGFLFGAGKKPRPCATYMDMSGCTEVSTCVWEMDSQKCKDKDSSASFNPNDPSIDCSGQPKETCNAPTCMWNVYSKPQKCVSQSAIVSDEDRQGTTGGLLPNISVVHDLNITKQDSNKASDSSYAPYKPSAADRKHQRAKLLRDIQKIVHNELLSERGTTGSRTRCDDDYDDSCDNSAALQQGCEMEDTCN